MKKNRFSLILAILIAVMMLFVSCEAEPEGNEGTPEVIIPGRWAILTEEGDATTVRIWEFLENGTFYEIYHDSETSIYDTDYGLYDLEEGAIKLTYLTRAEGSEYDYQIKDGSLVLTNDDEEIVFLNMDEKREGVEIDDALIGRWAITLGNGDSIETEYTKSGIVSYKFRDSEGELDSFRANISDSTVTGFRSYEVNKESKTIMFIGDEMKYDLSEEGNKLTLRNLGPSIEE